MKVGILMQYEHNSVMKWQYHAELYYKEQGQANDIKNALESVGIEVIVWGSFRKFYNQFKSMGLSVDVVINGIENCFGVVNNGLVTSFLEMNDIPYIGNNTFVNLISSDKAFMQDIATSLGIKTPKYIEFTNSDINDIKLRMLKEHISLPCVLKYRRGTMSYKTIKIDDKEKLYKTVLCMLGQEKDSVLCEEYISGREVTVPIIGFGQNTEILSVIEYTDSKKNPIELYDTKWKEENDHLVQLCRLDDSLEYVKILKSASLKLYHYLGFRDLARFDFRLSSSQVPYFLEANSIPNISLNSAFDPHSYGGSNSFTDTLLKIINYSYKRYNE